MKEVNSVGARELRLRGYALAAPQPLLRAAVEA